MYHRIEPLHRAILQAAHPFFSLTSVSAVGCLVITSHLTPQQDDSKDTSSRPIEQSCQRQSHLPFGGRCVHVLCEQCTPFT